MGLKSYELGGLLAFWSVFFTLLSYITFDPTGASCAPTRVRARHVLAPTARTRLRQGARSVTPTGTGRMSSHHSRSHRTPARITPARITAAPTSRARSPHVCRSHVVLLSLSPPPPPPPPRQPPALQLRSRATSEKQVSVGYVGIVGCGLEVVRRVHSGRPDPCSYMLKRLAPRVSLLPGLKIDYY